MNNPQGNTVSEVGASTAHTIIDEIAAERTRQIKKEGWSLEHDDDHDDGSLAAAAACYAHPDRIFVAEQYAGLGYKPYTTYRDAWPKSWADQWWKPKARRKNLVRAAALIIAEIERLDRRAAIAKATGTTDTQRDSVNEQRVAVVHKGI